MQEHKAFTLNPEDVDTTYYRNVFRTAKNSMSQPKTQEPVDIHRCEQLQISNWFIWINTGITGGLLQTW